MRIPQYLDEIAEGEIDPGSTPRVTLAFGARADIEGNRCFGPVAGSFAADEAVALARREGVSLVTVRHAGHAGRIGDYVESIAESGLVGVAVCSGPRSGHRVAPFGGLEGRLATNPIAYAVPTPTDPIVADFSTSTVPEGVVRRLRDIGHPVPEGALQDVLGQATSDPGVLYRSPPGTILPLGGPAFGHKGFALGLLVEVLATLLAGDETADGGRYGNNLALMAVAVDEEFAARAGHLAAYVQSAAPGDPGLPVLMPGDPERSRIRDDGRVAVDSATWSSLAAVAAARGIPLPEAASFPPAGLRDVGDLAANGD